MATHASRTTYPTYPTYTSSSLVREPQHDDGFDHGYDDQADRHTDPPRAGPCAHSAAPEAAHHAGDGVLADHTARVPRHRLCGDRTSHLLHPRPYRHTNTCPTAQRL